MVVARLCIHINATLTRSSALIFSSDAWSRALFPSYERQRERERKIYGLRGTEEGQESGREYKTDKEEEALIA